MFLVDGEYESSQPTYFSSCRFDHCLYRSAWRHRLPNDYEDLTVWDDVFTWRSHMFNAITSNFKWSDPGTLATLHDQPWTAIRLATTARKQDLREVSV